MMRLLVIPYNDELLIRSNQSQKVLENELRFLLALKLFELKRLPLSKAADFCEMSKLHFVYELGRLQIPIISSDHDHIAEELYNG